MPPHLRFGIAGNRGEGRVDGNDSSFGVEYQNGVLGCLEHRLRQPLVCFRSLALGDVAAGTAIADKPAGGIEPRLAVDAEPVLGTAVQVPPVLEVPKRLVSFQHGSVFRPLFGRHVAGYFPAGLTQQRGENDAGPLQTERRVARGKIGESKLLVLLPEPVRRHGRQVAKPCFAGENRLFALANGIRHMLKTVHQIGEFHDAGGRPRPVVVTSGDRAGLLNITGEALRTSAGQHRSSQNRQ